MNGIKIKYATEWWQHKILRFIIDFAAANKERVPSYREIGEGMSQHNEGKPISSMIVHYHLKRMRDEGFITFKPNTTRSIKITDKGYAYAAQDDWQERGDES